VDDFRDEDRDLRRQWEMLDYENDESGCVNCGRQRVCICTNGMRRCEKCNFVKELNDYCPVDL
jgi:ribosomal protein L37AE/L43A